MSTAHSQVDTSEYSLECIRQVPNDDGNVDSAPDSVDQNYALTRELSGTRLTD